MLLQTSESDIPAFHVSREAGSTQKVVLTGKWTLRGLARHASQLTEDLKPYTRDPDMHWDLTHIEAMDSVGAFVLWQINNRQPPTNLELQPEHLNLFRRWADRRISSPSPKLHRHFSLMDSLARAGFKITDHLAGFLNLVGQFVLDAGFLIRHPVHIPWKEISATIYQAGVRALGVTAIIGLLIGIVVSYLGALALRAYGAEAFIINLLGLSVIRELGPVLASILVAGRSGSAMTAELGVMRVTQELDALAAMGTSQSLRLVLPKVIALTIVVPLLVVWTDSIAMLGGMLATHATFDIGYMRFLETLPKVVPVVNFWLGLGKSMVFGGVIALIACHYGLRVKPNTESLSVETTNAVVAGITMVIVLDGIISVVFRNAGLL
ncbi:MAG: MlaE family ABC transporter permease [Gammaproteobacteria bacterium]